MTVPAAYIETFGLRCVRCNAAPTEGLLLALREREAAVPNVLVVYAQCATCNKDEAGDVARDALRPICAPSYMRFLAVCEREGVTTLTLKLERK